MHDTQAVIAQGPKSAELHSWRWCVVNPEVCWNGVGNWAINLGPSSSLTEELRCLLCEVGLENLKTALVNPGTCFSLATHVTKYKCWLDWWKKPKEYDSSQQEGI